MITKYTEDATPEFQLPINVSIFKLKVGRPGNKETKRCKVKFHTMGRRTHNFLPENNELRKQK